MQTIEAIKTRRSIRKFTDQPVPHEIVEQIVAASAWAPSWKNSQTAGYIAVEDRALIQRIAEEGTLTSSHNKSILLDCPLLVVLVSETGICGYEKDGSFTTSKKDRWEMFDAGIAAQTFMLAAHEYGIGTVMMGIFDDAKIAGVLGLPENKTVSALIAAGYPAVSPEAPKRKTPEELLEYR